MSSANLQDSSNPKPLTEGIAGEPSRHQDLQKKFWLIKSQLAKWYLWESPILFQKKCTIYKLIIFMAHLGNFKKDKRYMGMEAMQAWSKINLAL